jgi:hypothetical protein
MGLSPSPGQFSAGPQRPRNQAEIEPKHEQHKADDEQEAHVMERHHDLLAHRSPQHALQNEKHHVAAIEQWNRQKIDDRKVGAQ